jgi:hypothetical protein
VAELILTDTLVEIRGVVLRAGDRAPQLPEDTSRVPLEMRVKGKLVEPGRLGEQVEVVTAAGRRVRGVLAEINPAYGHGFGSPIAELSAVGAELRAMLRAGGDER